MCPHRCRQRSDNSIVLPFHDRFMRYRLQVLLDQLAAAAAQHFGEIQGVEQRQNEVQPADLLQLKNYLWNEPGEIEKVQAVLTRLCDDPLRTRLEELLAKAAEMRDAFDAAPDNGKAKALVQLRTEFAGLYREWQALDVGATTDEQHRQAADALNTLEEMSRKAHEACAFTPVPLAQLAVLQSAA